MSALIKLTNVTYAYPGRGNALNGLDFHLHAGDKLGLMGPNGAGKTTMLHILMGLIAPQSGEVELFGKRMETSKDFDEVRLRIGFLFQHTDDQLFCPTVLDDVAFGPLNQGLSRTKARERALEALATVGMEGFEDHVPYRLSGGEKRLVALATLLSMRPEVLILDEPTTGLSPDAKDRLVSILNSLALPRLVVSHNPDFLGATTNTILAMQNGKVRPGTMKPHTHVHVHAEGDVPHQH
ncbi:energy-coupling factor ABC transporter ATP-binding protein [Pseudodesulfovibrio tunisiensis]|uniref:energy-coupling factor ABC transporter ATP-binding protein n=1 Tax=Pseudodesulfovibrio tunisiensis TaxID=463192 RepID=UPI001FB1CA42|nr:ABC transporter ATP-binding protein [Pseudodesulfovibrio tunisiensis]